MKWTVEAVLPMVLGVLIGLSATSRYCRDKKISLGISSFFMLVGVSFLMEWNAMILILTSVVVLGIPLVLGLRGLLAPFRYRTTIEGTYIGTKDQWVHRQYKKHPVFDTRYGTITDMHSYDEGWLEQNLQKGKTYLLYTDKTYTNATIHPTRFFIRNVLLVIGEMGILIGLMWIYINQ